MRPYNSDTDYPIVLEACRQHGMWITPVANALRDAGVRWPAGFGINYPGQQVPYPEETNAIDRDIRRAWKELGLRNP